MILKTNIDGLVLRNYTLEDSESYSSYASNYNIWKFFRDEFPYPYAKDKAEEYIKKTCIRNETNFFAMSLNGKLIGDIHVAQQTDILRLSGFLGIGLQKIFGERDL